MDEAFACLMSDLLQREHPRAVLQVDMVGCEHTETCLAVKYANSQVQHTIGQKQTEKCQVTDVRMSKIAKDAQRAAAPSLRTAQRRLAQEVGQAPQLISKHAQALFLCLAMHEGLEKDQREHNGVIKAARSAGMLHWLPTSTGLRRADGPEWAQLTSGSSRIPEAAWRERESHVLEGGQPERPDWRRLKDVQKRLAEEAQRALAQGLPSFGPLDSKPKVENPWNTMTFTGESVNLLCKNYSATRGI